MAGENEGICFPAPAVLRKCPRDNRKWICFPAQRRGSAPAGGGAPSVGAAPGARPRPALQPPDLYPIDRGAHRPRAERAASTGPRRLDALRPISPKGRSHDR
jgi:hypothetical protein